MTTEQQPIKKTYVRRSTGNDIHPNLDDDSLSLLTEAQAILKRENLNVSQSVMIRRAVRIYNAYLKQISDFSQESVLLRRATKGIM